MPGPNPKNALTPQQLAQAYAKMYASAGNMGIPAPTANPGGSGAINQAELDAAWQAMHDPQTIQAQSQTLRPSQTPWSTALRVMAPGLAREIAAHPLIKDALLMGNPDLRGIVNGLQGVGREGLHQGLRLINYASPKAGAALKSRYGKYASPLPGFAPTVGRTALDFGEMMAMPATESPLFEAAKMGGMNALQGGSPWAGAAMGAAGPLAGKVLQNAAPWIAERAMGIDALDRLRNSEPGRFLLDHLAGLTPETIANSAYAMKNDVGERIGQLASNASQPQYIPGMTPPLGLPMGPVEPESIPLHEATAVWERPTIAQPAERVTNQQTSLYSYRPVYNTSPAMNAERLAYPSVRNAVEARAAELPEEGRWVNPGVTNPAMHWSGNPLQTMYVTEPAQGVWLRNPESAPLRGGMDAGQMEAPKPIDLQPARDQLEKMRYDNRNSPAAMAGLNRLGTHLFTDHVPSGITNGMIDYDPVPRERFVSAAEAQDIKQKIGNEVDAFRKSPEVHLKTADSAAKRIYGTLDSQLDHLLGTQYTELNRQYGPLKTIAGKSARASLDDPAIMQAMRMANVRRLGYGTIGMLGSGLGGAYLGEKQGGPKLALEYGLTGALLPALAASPTADMALARALNAAPKLVPAAAKLGLALHNAQTR